MSLESRRQYLAVTAKRYAKSSPIERRTILSEFVAATGYERNYAIRLLNHPPVLPLKGIIRRARCKTYDASVQKPLEFIWRTAGGICGKRRRSGTLRPSLKGRTGQYPTETAPPGSSAALVSMTVRGIKPAKKLEESV